MSVSYLAASSFDIAGERSFSEFASDAILWLKRERLAREMEEGYREPAQRF